MVNNFKTALVTGAAGFIGAATCKKLLKEGINVIGIDDLNDYYSVNLKKNRLEEIDKISKITDIKWEFYKNGIEDFDILNYIFKKNKPDVVINLAAQAGVRHSIKKPFSFVKSNLNGFTNILELCREYKINNLIFASSSSVYGGNRKMPYSENDPVNHPLSLYGATKRSNELIAHTYSHVFGIPTIGLRFFTVYGPWGRPDMAPMLFANAILHNEPIQVFNYGEMERDFTFIDDIVEAIFKCCFKPATPNNKFDYLNPDPSSSFAPYRLFNIGNSRPIKLLKFIEILEKEIGIKAVKNFKPMVKGDVKSTKAECLRLSDWIQFTPKTSIDRGVEYFIKWYRDYYSI